MSTMANAYVQHNKSGDLHRDSLLACLLHVQKRGAPTRAIPITVAIPSQKEKVILQSRRERQRSLNRSQTYPLKKDTEKRITSLMMKIVAVTVAVAVAVAVAAKVMERTRTGDGDHCGRKSARLPWPR